MTASLAPAVPAGPVRDPAPRPAGRRPLGAYTDSAGRRREIVTRPGAHGSTLVIDEDAATLADRRLVAHLPCDEPPANALLVCRLYLDDGPGRLPRAVVAAAWRAAPGRGTGPDPPDLGRELVDGRRRAYRLAVRTTTWGGGE